MKKILPLNALWAKTTPFKSLYCHMLETGYVMELLLKESVFSSYIKCFLDNCNIDEEEVLIDSLCYLAAIHDIGKAHPVFQFRNSEIDLPNKLKSNHSITGFRHEIYTGVIFRRIWKTNDKAQRKSLRTISKILEMHHQGKNPCFDMQISPNDVNEQWEIIQNELHEKIQSHFPFTPFLITENVNGFSLLLNTMIVFSDWVASTKLFDNVSFDDNHEINVKKQIRVFLKENSLSLEEKKISSDPYILFPFLEQFGLNALQKQIMDMPLSNAQCLIIEAPMGTGKTEAGILAALKMGENKSGLYFALPTYATSKAMRPRFQDVLDNSSLNFSTELLSGFSWLDEYDEEKSKFFSGSRMNLFYPYSVGTIDQILKAEKLLKYNFLRMFAVGTKCAVLDEVHSYDAYMMGILKPLLKWFQFLQVPVVIQSATLPPSIKKEICEVYGRKYESHFSYPLVTVLSKTGISYYPVSAPDSKKYSISIHNYKEFSEVADLAIKAVENNGCCCVIMNTVKSAIQVYDEIKSLKDDDIEIYLLHARDTFANKEIKTENILKKFGKNRDNRPRKAIVVSTQILEQSIDVDFDYMISELCPVDLLLQRSGRLHRHSDNGTIREKNPFNPRLHVMCPEKNAKIYYPALLERTHSVLKRYPSISVPKDIPILVDEVYKEEVITSDDLAWFETQRELYWYSQKSIIGIPEDKKFVLSEKEVYLHNVDDAALSTRFSEYESIAIAICPSFDSSICSDREKAASFYRNYVVSVPSFLLEKDFRENENYSYGEKWLKNVVIYKGDKYVLDLEYGFIQNSVLD